MRFSSGPPTKVIGNVTLTPTSKLKGITTPVTAAQAAGDVYQVADAMDYLGATNASGSGINSATVVAPKSYSGILVVSAAGLAFWVQDATLAATLGATNVPRFPSCLSAGAAVGTNGRQYGVSGCANEPGHDLTITTYTTAAATSWIYGLTRLPIVLRRDLRAKPVGAFRSSTGTATTGPTQVLIPAPPLTLRIVLRSVKGYLLSSGASEVFATLTGWQSGNATVFSLLAAPPNGAVPIDIDLPDGLVFDPGRSIVIWIKGTGMNLQIAATYDLQP